MFIEKAVTAPIALPHRNRAELIHEWDNWCLRLPTDDRERIIEQAALLNPEAKRFHQEKAALYGFGCLNAPSSFFRGPDGVNQHHFHARFGVQLTSDFKNFVVLRDDALVALPSESSIWSGSLAAGPAVPAAAGRTYQYLFFYTSRDPHSPDGMTQEVRLAFSADFVNWRRAACVLKADSRWYETQSIRGDTTVHGFRDPFPFRFGERAFLLVNAKSRFLEPGKIGERAGANGVVAVYRGTGKRALTEWEATPLCFETGKPEADCPALYYDKEKKEHVLTFSCQSKDDYLRRRSGPAGAIEGAIDERPEMWEARITNLDGLLKSPPCRPVTLSPVKVTDAHPFSYANRIVPEMGLLLGFDTRQGRPLISPSTRFGNLESVCADFTDFAALP